MIGNIAQYPSLPIEWILPRQMVLDSFLFFLFNLSNGLKKQYLASLWLFMREKANDARHRLSMRSFRGLLSYTEEGPMNNRAIAIMMTLKAENHEEDIARRNRLTNTSVS